TSATAIGTPKTAIPTRRLTPTPETTRPVTQLEVAAGDLAGLEVVFWHSWDGRPGEVIGQLVEEFNRHNEWAVQVRAEFQGTLDQLDVNVLQLTDQAHKPNLVAVYLYQALNWGSEAELVAMDAYVNDPIWG